MIVKSDSISKLSAALCSFQGKMGAISKENLNPFFKSKYASLSTILEAIQSPMFEAGLAITQFPDDDKLTTILIHGESGQFLESSYKMPVSKQNDPQAVGSAITYARRYAIGAVLSLNIDEDDDANSASDIKKNNAAQNIPSYKQKYDNKNTISPSSQPTQQKESKPKPASTISLEDDLEITTLKDHYVDTVKTRDDFDTAKIKFAEGWKALAKFSKLEEGRKAMQAVERAFKDRPDYKKRTDDKNQLSVKPAYSA